MMDARFDSWIEDRALAESDSPTEERMRAEGWPFCSYCGRPMLADKSDWNEETGEHLSCEEAKTQ